MIVETDVSKAGKFSLDLARRVCFEKRKNRLFPYKKQIFYHRARRPSASQRKASHFTIMYYVRSAMTSLSNWAMADIRGNSSLPVGVLVSMDSFRLTSWTPFSKTYGRCNVDFETGSGTKNSPKYPVLEHSGLRLNNLRFWNELFLVFQGVLRSFCNQINGSAQYTALHETGQRRSQRRKQNRHTNLSSLKLPPVRGQRPTERST